MKKPIFKLSVLAAAFLTLFCYGFRPASTQPLKITICHMPPGNVENCQEICISMEAFQTHIEHHDDALVCHDQKEHDFYKVLSVKSNMKLVTAFE